MFPHTRVPALTRALLLAALIVPSAARCVAAAPASPYDTTTASRPGRPGRMRDGRMRLPTGWHLSPAGRGVKVGEFPMGLAVSPDERFAVVNCIAGEYASIDIVDLANGTLVQSVPLPGSWLGLAFLGRDRLAASAGVRNRVMLYSFVDGHATLADSIVIGPPWSAGGQYPQGRVIDYGPGNIWPTGLSADSSGRRLWVASRFDSALREVDVDARSVTRRLALGGVPWTCLASRDGRRVFVSLWSASEVAIVDAATLRVTARVPVGSHPTGLVESPDGARVFVAEANRNTVSVIDVAAARVAEVLDASPLPGAPPGGTPDGVALDRTGTRLSIANAGTNCVAIFDVSRPGRSRPLGFVPVGWYPTAVAVLPSTGTLVVANGRGTGSRPTNVAPPDTGAWCRYLSWMLRDRGSLSIVPAPDAATLAAATRAVYANRPEAPPLPKGPVPRRPGERTPIRYVFYIFKENRSYDQVFGDLPQGDGDPALCTYGETITPNHHAIAKQWVLLDHTYVEADGSADGHNWGMAAYSTDYVTKSAGTSPIYDYEGGNPLSFPEPGYLWDAAIRAGVSVRSYGEYVFNPDDPRDTVRAAVPALEGRIAPKYRGYDTSYSDLDRYAAWLEEFDRYDRDGGLPSLSIIRLPNDHTEGTCTGRPTPRAHVAENDLALGMMLERISHSRYWKECAVFVIEDDAANGPDHVDAHRTPALVAGPWVKRRAVDPTLYTNSGMLHTIELILGMRPMSTFDATATPMNACFTSRPDFTPFVHENARVDIHETNVAGAWGQEWCDGQNWKVADAVPAAGLTEVLWRDARGAGAPLPPLVRSAFALRSGAGPAREDDEDDDD